MAPAISPALFLLVALAASGPLAADPSADADACIAGKLVIGCESQRALDEIDAYSEERQGRQGVILRAISSGACTLFRDGDRVTIVDRAFTTERRLVARAGERKAFWVAAAETRAATGCAAAPSTHPEAATARTEAPPRPRDDPAAANPTAPAATKDAPRLADDCNYKRVMSDAEIAACRERAVARAARPARAGTGANGSERRDQPPSPVPMRRNASSNSEPTSASVVDGSLL